MTEEERRHDADAYADWWVSLSRVQRFEIYIMGIVAALLFGAGLAVLDEFDL